MSPENELEIIAQARRLFGKSASGGKVALGIGDDCASIIPTPGREILLSTDTLAESVHFLPELSTPEDIGAKSVYTAVSDIAAMGGEAVALLLSINIHGVDRKWIGAFLKGASRAARVCRARIVGGNVSAAAALSFTVTAVGEVKKGLRVDRSGASPGEVVYVTGHPGESALGLDIILERKKRPAPWEKRLIRRHFIPRPRLAWGALLAGGRIASAMIDVSDGVILDFRRMAEASGAGGRLWLGKLPISPAAKTLMRKKGVNETLQRMATGGEDYELLFSVRKGKEGMLTRLIGEGAIEAWRIGEITGEKGKLEIFGEDGKKVDFRNEGWLHS
jgi:thiamine-monophosphate kinase